MSGLLSWGRYPRTPQAPHAIHWADDVGPAMEAMAAEGIATTLAYGCGRSYGDSCLATSNHVLAMQPASRVLEADWSTGIIRAQAGLTLAELIRIALPRGWFLPVTPGTKFVTLGGAVANDVHGKNHHVMGTFGCHVQRLVLYRSDEGMIECGPLQRPELFSATVGGLGLTGVIVEVELRLRRVSSRDIGQRSIKFGNLDEFFDLSETYDTDNEYTVAWIDCLARGRHAGRGHYFAGNHLLAGTLEPLPPGRLNIPFDPPVSLINGLSLRAFNFLYYHRQRQREVQGNIGYDAFFYPLDSIAHWNRMYGKPGFQQYQCVVPAQHAREVIRAIMKEIATSGTGSFLAVLKQCGTLPSPGLLSFPLHGVSLALDFPQHENANNRLFARLDALVHEASGRLYPAKDAHMSAAHFKQAYPHWSKVEALRDPRLLSQFWKRVIQ